MRTLSKLSLSAPGQRAAARILFWRQLGLGLKMTLIVLVGLVALIALFGYIGTAALDANIASSLQERVVLAQTMARHIDYVLANIEHVLTEHAREPGLLDPARREEALERIYASTSFFADQVFFVDRDARAVAAYPASTAQISFPNARSVQAALQGQSFAVSRRAHLIGSARRSTLAMVPVRDAQSNVVGALVVSVDLYSPNLNAFTHPVGLAGTGYMDLTDMDGWILASTQPARVGKQSDHDTTLARMIQAQQPAVSRCHDCHTAPEDTAPHREILAFAPLTRAQWGVTVRQDEQEIVAGARELQLRIFAVGALALAGALVLVYLTTRSVISPVQSLTTAAQRIAEGDLETPIAAKGRDEIGMLARAFDTMRVKLYGFNRELDARVQERTAALAAAQRQAQQSHDHLQKIIDSLDDELLVIDRDFQVTYVNAAVERKHGKGLIGAPCFQVTHTDTRCEVPECDCPLRLVLGSGKAMRQTHTHADNGATRFIEVTASPLFDAEGRLDGVVELLRDVTEEKQLAEIIQQRNREKEQLRGELLRRTIAAQEDERKRIARELHDETSQLLTSLLFTLEEAGEACNTAEMPVILERMHYLIFSALDGVQKIILDLRPTLLDQFGLVAALRSFVKTRFTERELQVEFVERGEPARLPSAVETAVFRTVQEALNNAARHSGARHLRLSLEFCADAVAVCVQDDGIGFDPNQVATSSDPRCGLGLVSMQERIDAVGGTFILSTAPGKGTRVCIRVPLKENGDEPHSSIGR